jgi:hypothetical protein
MEKIVLKIKFIKILNPVMPTTDLGAFTLHLFIHRVVRTIPLSRSKCKNPPPSKASHPR